MADFVTANGKLEFVPSLTMEQIFGNIHFWTIPEGMIPGNRAVILMPRNAYTAELSGFSGPFEHSVVVKSKSVPDIVLAAMVGKRGGEIIGHWFFEEGMPGFDAIITWSFSDKTGILLTFDRPVHIDIIEIRERTQAEFRQQRPELTSWLNNELGQPYVAKDEIWRRRDGQRQQTLAGR